MADFMKPPDAIYLQYHGDGDPDDTGPVNSDDVTWCWEQINEQDIKYVRADLVKEMKSND